MIANFGCVFGVLARGTGCASDLGRHRSGFSGTAGASVWPAGMSVGAVTVRLRQETGRGILIRWAGTPAVRSKGEAQYERFSCSRA